MRNIGLVVCVILPLVFVVSCGGAAVESAERGRVTLVEPEDDGDDFVIARQNYDKALAQGPSWFIQQIRVLPVVVDNRFRGFMLTRIFDREQAHGLQAGDIVQRVNGHSIERPDQFMAAWGTLKGAEALQAHIVRNNQPLELTWVIR